MPKSILLVDDQPDAVLSRDFMMRRAWIGCLQCIINGTSTRVAIENDSADLVMPYFDVMLAAKGVGVENKKDLARGADDYLVKPLATWKVVENLPAIPGTRT